LSNVQNASKVKYANDPTKQQEVVDEVMKALEEEV
jgi:hypothetical protein